MRSITNWPARGRWCREPPLALIRLQWWREVVEGAHRRHEVAEPLRAAIEAGALHRGDLLALIDAREAETEPVFETVQDWHGYLFGSAGGLAVAAGVCWVRPIQRDCGRWVRRMVSPACCAASPHTPRQRRCLLPADTLAAHGLIAEQVIAAPSSARMAVDRLAKEALALLQPMRLPRRTVAAALPAVLARRDLRRAPVFLPRRGLGDRLAVMIAGLTGRV